MRKLVLAALALPLLAGGCVWNRMKINDPSVAERAAAIKPGVTKASEIVDIIGAQPTMRLPGKEAMLYGYTYGDTKTGGLMLILFNFMRSTTVTDTLYISIDPKTEIVQKVYLPDRHELEWEFWPFGN